MTSKKFSKATFPTRNFDLITISRKQNFHLVRFVQSRSIAIKPSYGKTARFRVDVRLAGRYRWGAKVVGFRGWPAPGKVKHEDTLLYYVCFVRQCFYLRCSWVNYFLKLSCKHKKLSQRTKRARCHILNVRLACFVYDHCMASMFSVKDNKRIYYSETFQIKVAFGCISWRWNRG